MRDPSMAMPGEVANVEYASPGIRFVALLIDVVILSIIQTVVNLIFGADPAEVNPGASIINFIIGAAYFIVLISQWGTTVGGRIVSIKVVDTNGGQPSWGTAAIRWVISIVSAAVFFIGYLWAFWDRNKQTWQDKVANTYVVKA
jgi:uncharacterized RDD family membrane protein YckC